MRREIKIGIFLTGTLVVLAVFIFVVGNLSNLFRRPGYPVIVRYETSLGLDKSAAVKMAGIKIGYVKNIELENNRSKVTLSINPRFRIPVGSRAVQAVQGLLGEKYVEVQPGTAAEAIPPDGELAAGPSSGLDQLAPMLAKLGGDLEEAAGSLREMMNQESRENFARALENIASLSSDLRAFMSENKAKLNQTVDSASSTARNLDQEVRVLTKDFGDTLADLRDILKENRGDVRDNLAKLRELLAGVEESVKVLNRTLQKIDSGQGTVGKLINDEGLYHDAQDAVRDVRKISAAVADIRLAADLRAEYLERTEFFKTAFSLALWQRQKVFFKGGVSHQPDRSATGGGEVAVSAEVGARWAGFSPRAGIIESAFGAGFDFYTLSDRLVLSVEGSDFGRPESPLFRTFARFYPRKYVYLVLGLEDFTLVERREVFLGLGLSL